MVDVLNRTIVACQKDLDQQCRPRGSTTIRRKTLRRIRHLVELDNWSNVTFGGNGQLVESYFSLKCV